MTGDEDTGYVHDPEAFREATTDDASRKATAIDDRNSESNEREFGRRGWTLVAMLFVAFVLVPVAILYLPHARPVIAAFGLTFRDAYLVLPLVPALVLGALAVWVALGNRSA